MNTPQEINWPTVVAAFCPTVVPMCQPLPSSGASQAQAQFPTIPLTSCIPSLSCLPTVITCSAAQAVPQAQAQGQAQAQFPTIPLTSCIPSLSCLPTVITCSAAQAVPQAQAQGQLLPFKTLIKCD